MSASRGFVGKPARAAIPKLCARCHSDATVIHKFRPQGMSWFQMPLNLWALHAFWVLLEV